MHSFRQTKANTLALTIEDINDAIVDEVCNVDRRASLSCNFLRQTQRTRGKRLNESLQDCVLKGRLQQFSMCLPLIAGTRDESIAEEVMQQLVHESFLDVLGRAENHLQMLRIHNDERWIHAEPEPWNRSVLFICCGHD